MFAPDVSSGQHTAIPPKKLSEAVGIKVIKKVHGIQLFLPEGRSIKEVSIYNCNGSLLYHNSMNIAKTTVTKFVRLPKGFYVVSVQTEKEKIIRRLCID